MTLSAEDKKYGARVRPIQPPSILLQGPSGTGKSTAIASLLEAGLEVFDLVTEPNGVESTIDAIYKKKLDLNKFHYHYVCPSNVSWKGMLDVATQIGRMDFAEISKLSKTTRDQNLQLIEVIKACNDFPCDRTGQMFGDVTTWGDDRAFIIDSLTGINVMAMELVIGKKVTASPGEWGVAMNTIESLLRKLTSDRSCFFVLIAHVERELNEVTGQQQIMAATLGKKLAPKIPIFFSECPLAERKGDKFSWNTAAINVDQKNRALPISNTLHPSFVPIIQHHRKRVEFTSAGREAEARLLNPGAL